MSDILSRPQCVNDHENNVSLTTVFTGVAYFKPFVYDRPVRDKLEGGGVTSSRDVTRNCGAT